MRKLIFTTACLVLFSLALAEAQIYVAPKMGISLNRFSTKGNFVQELFSPKSQIGYLFGVAVDIPLISGLSVQPEASFHRASYKLQAEVPTNFLIDHMTINNTIEWSAIAFYWDEVYNVNQIDIPILIKYEFIGGGFGYFIEAGPTFSFGVGGKTKGSLRDLDGNEESNTVLTDQYGGIATSDYTLWVESHRHTDLLPSERATLQEAGLVVITSGSLGNEITFGDGNALFNTLNLSLTVGSGIYFETGYGRFYVGVRYLRGLSSYWKEEYLNSIRIGGTAFDTRTNNLQLSVSYAFPLGGGF
jgi:hypothetical protein